MIKIEITFDPATQKLQMACPTGDKVLMYGILELAKDAIRAQPAANAIVPVRAIPKLNGAN